MKFRIELLFLAFLSISLPATASTNELSPESETQRTQRTASLVLQVFDREQVSETLIDSAVEFDGWFSNFTLDEIGFRIPTRSLDDFLDLVHTQGQVVERQYRSVDHGAEIAELRARLNGREEVLERYMEVLEDASSEAIVAVERQVIEAVEEIEEIEGLIRYLEHQVAYAEVVIDFQFRDRSAPIRNGNSSFRWLNQLNLADLMNDFNRSGSGRAPSRSFEAPIPEGFAAYDERRRIRATSPEGVVYRVRLQRNRPEANLSFWSEALRIRMIEAGYLWVSEEPIRSGDHDGYLVEFTAAGTQEDHRYLIAVFVLDTQLVVVEAAGSVEQFGPHRESIVTAVESIF